MSKKLFLVSLEQDELASWKAKFNGKDEGVRAHVELDGELDVIVSGLAALLAHDERLAYVVVSAVHLHLMGDVEAEYYNPKES